MWIAIAKMGREKLDYKSIQFHSAILIWWCLTRRNKHQITCMYKQLVVYFKNDSSSALGHACVSWMPDSEGHNVDNDLFFVHAYLY